MIPDTPADLLSAIDAAGHALPRWVVTAFAAPNWRANLVMAEAHEAQAAQRARERWASRIPPTRLIRHIVRLGHWVATMDAVMDAVMAAGGRADERTAMCWLQGDAVYWLLVAEARAAGLSSPWPSTEAA